jgi:orotate phosphoribosyltransferase
MDPRRRLLQLLTDRAFQRRAVTLSSGRTSNFYIDCKEVTLDAEGARWVGLLLLERLRAYEHRSGRSVAAVGGLTLGADPIATAVSLTSFLEGAPKPAFIVRKEAKGHGTGRYLEGTSRLAAGAELAVVEDVVTTGGSSLRAVERLREAGFVVRRVFAIVDRCEGGRQHIEAADLELDALYLKSDFMEE